jgi:PIN domain nuclease of toxin-antitoxin system
MRALLDTHAFLWAITDDMRLSRRARDIFTGSSDLSISIVSIWEILIKVQNGKMNLPKPAGDYVLGQLADNRIETLGVTLNHLLAFEQLQLHHRDPFNRMLIAQSVEEDLPIITADRYFNKYPVRVIW